MNENLSWRQLREKWQGLDPQQRKNVLRSLSSEQIRGINWWLVQYAREKQLPPEGNWFCWLLRSGRGFGKTRTGAEFILQRVQEGYKYIALIGQTKADVRDTMVELGESSIIKVAPPHLRPIYEMSKRRLTFPNGAVATIYSGDEPDQLRGPQHDTAWVDELAKFRYPQDTWDNLEFGLRLADKPQVVVTTTPRPIPIIHALLSDPDTVDVRGSSKENEANLSERFISRVIRRYENTRLGRQELYGEILDDTPGALWTRAIIERYRVSAVPKSWARVVVGVDPAASPTGETGIVVAAKARDDKGVWHAYVLDDVTTEGTPARWAAAGISAYNKYAADLLVGEINNGGAMVEYTIRSTTGGERLAYKAVHASRGKYTRAEPISTLYEGGRVHHVGYFAELEDQMCTYVPGDSSPDRMDALVWALTELMLGEDAEVQVSANPFYR